MRQLLEEVDTGCKNSGVPGLLAITSLGETTRPRRFRPYDGRNERLRFIDEKLLDGLLAITPMDL
jgi:hypothetical protein